MSIHAEMEARLRELCDQRVLFPLSPLLPGDPTVRHMFVSQEVNESIQWPFPEHWDGYRLAEFRGTLDAFIKDEELRVGEDPFNKDGDADLARVHPVSADIWDIRTLNPPDGVRCFGCFAGTDIFVALTWDYRENIHGAQGWEDQVQRCAGEWNKLFNPHPPFHGETLDEYLSGNFYPV